MHQHVIYLLVRLVDTGIRSRFCMLHVKILQYSLHKIFKFSFFLKDRSRQMSLLTNFECNSLRGIRSYFFGSMTTNLPNSSWVWVVLKCFIMALSLTDRTVSLKLHCSIWQNLLSSSSWDGSATLQVLASFDSTLLGTGPISTHPKIVFSIVHDPDLPVRWPWCIKFVEYISS